MFSQIVYYVVVIAGAVAVVDALFKILDWIEGSTDETTNNGTKTKKGDN